MGSTTIETKGLVAQDLVHGAGIGNFRPGRFLGNGHLMTIVGNFLPREVELPVAEPWFVEVEPPTADRRSTLVRCDCDWQSPEVRQDRLTLVLVHGLEGSSRSQYVLGTASRAWAAGCNVIRVNMRSCGNTDELSPGIYHSGRSEDIAAIVNGLVGEHGLHSIALVGYSMGGNLVLKYTGEVGDSAPLQLRAAVGVSPLMDLAASSKALHEIGNRIYERRFLGNMLRRFHRKTEIFPEIYLPEGLEAIRVVRSVGSMRQFDQEIVARYGNFASAEDYYDKVASSRVVAQIALPTLVIHALDDPFIRMLPSTRAALLANQALTLVETRYGGHCAFLSTDRGSDKHWAEKSLVEWLIGIEPAAPK